MKRRDFLKYSSVGLTLPFWMQYCDFSGLDFPVSLNSDHKAGHLLFASKDWKLKKGADLEVAIVGGGIAGLSAAYQLGDVNFRVFELSDKLGGTVSTEEYKGIQFSQGAHYDLAYPDNYGGEVLSVLEELNLISYEPWRKAWNFNDKQHLIPYYRRQQCYELGKRRRDVLPEGLLKSRFIELISQYQEEMKLPTRLIDPTYHHLNSITFKEFLQHNINPTATFLRQVDYHMFDDYGGATEQVSALAGIHYFACRPYYKEDVSLFSPPNGNAYFANALLRGISKERIKPSCLVRSIEKSGGKFALQVIDLKQNIVEEYTADRVIYAGQKHALKYVYPEQANLFENTYAPWMVVNLVTNQKKEHYGYWQNEYLGENERFLGFIDSSVQDQRSLRGKRVFTGYYCLRPADREYLMTVEQSREGIANETLSYVEEMLQEKFRIEAGFIKVMGHAMPIPAPDYLLRDANAAANAEMIYAGVDNGRLPLLFEALDSGLLAASLV